MKTTTNILKMVLIFNYIFMAKTFAEINLEDPSNQVIEMSFSHKDLIQKIDLIIPSLSGDLEESGSQNYVNFDRRYFKYFEIKIPYKTKPDSEFAQILNSDFLDRDGPAPYGCDIELVSSRYDKENEEIILSYNAHFLSYLMPEYLSLREPVLKEKILAANIENMAKLNKCIGERIREKGFLGEHNLYILEKSTTNTQDPSEINEDKTTHVVIN